jgi:uncharacterized membrane protein YeiH
LFPGQAGITMISFLVCVFGGMVSGFGGGIIRDAIMGDEPFALKKGSNYIFCAFLGSASFYVISLVSVNVAIIISMILTLYFREITSKFGVYHKIFLNK